MTDGTPGQVTRFASGKRRLDAWSAMGADWVGRFAPGGAISRRHMVALWTVTAVHMAALTIMADTEGDLVAKTAFLLAWILLNLFWLALLRRPVVAGGAPSCGVAGRPAAGRCGGDRKIGPSRAAAAEWTRPETRKNASGSCCRRHRGRRGRASCRPGSEDQAEEDAAAAAAAAAKAGEGHDAGHCDRADRPPATVDQQENAAAQLAVVGACNAQ